MKLNNCTQLLENLGIRDLTVLGARKSQEILEAISSRFVAARYKKKEIITVPSFIGSDLLRKIYLKLMKNAKTYVFTAEKGAEIIAVNARDGLSKCLKIAKQSIEKTCYIVCCDFTYQFRINYNGDLDPARGESYSIEMIA